MIAVKFWSFNDLIFSAKEAGLPSVMSMTLIVGCFWSRAISWALSLGIRFINTPCWWSIYKFDKNVVGMVEEGLLRKMNSPSFVRIFDTNVLRTMADWDVIYWVMSPWNITTNYLIGFRSNVVFRSNVLFRFNRVCFPVKVISLYPYRTFTVFLG